MGVVEDRFHRPVKQHGDAVGQVQRGVVLLGLQRIDRLTRHPQLLAQLFLGPAAFGAQQFQPKPQPVNRAMATPAAMMNCLAVTARTNSSESRIIISVAQI